MDNVAKGANVVIAVLWLMFALGFLAFTWDWITIFGEQLENDDFFYALYYVSVTVMIILTVFVPPIALITSAFKEETI